MLNLLFVYCFTGRLHLNFHKDLQEKTLEHLTFEKTTNDNSHCLVPVCIVHYVDQFEDHFEKRSQLYYNLSLNYEYFLFLPILLVLCHLIQLIYQHPTVTRDTLKKIKSFKIRHTILNKKNTKPNKHKQNYLFTFNAIGNSINFIKAAALLAYKDASLGFRRIASSYSFLASGN
jgi:hypothetical protein